MKSKRNYSANYLQKQYPTTSLFILSDIHRVDLESGYRRLCNAYSDAIMKLLDIIH